MELSQVLTAFVGWAVLSVPVSLLLGAFMAHANAAAQDGAVPIRVPERS